MALTCFLFPAVGLTAYGGVSGPTIRLMPPLLGGGGNEDRASGRLSRTLELLPRRATGANGQIRPSTEGEEGVAGTASETVVRSFDMVRIACLVHISGNRGNR
jgi:hypothetical protein